MHGARFIIIVVGAGGNIGSHLIPHLARMPHVRRVILVDCDAYERRNLASQDIGPHHVGQRKVIVQARRLRRLAAGLEVEALDARVETLPLGSLRGDVLIGAVDSRRARQVINEIAARLGMPWIDGGVDGESLRARVTVYHSGEDSPCLECAWEDGDYAALEQVFACSGTADVPATGAPSSIGALAASLQALECLKLLRGEREHALVGRQALIDTRHHRHYVMSFRRNPACRRVDHAPWTITPLPPTPGGLTLRGALRLGHAADDPAGAVTRAVGVAGQRFGRRLTCATCGHERPFLHIVGRLSRTRRTCRRCGAVMVAAGFDRTEVLDGSAITALPRDFTLREIGVRTGDVLVISDIDGRTAYHEITGDRGRDETNDPRKPDRDTELVRNRDGDSPGSPPSGAGSVVESGLIHGALAAPSLQSRMES